MPAKDDLYTAPPRPIAMSYKPPVYFREFSPAAVSFGEPKANQHGGKYVPLMDANGAQKRFEIITPVMHMPFGLSAFRDKKNLDAPAESYLMEVAFRNMDTDTEVRAFYEKMKEFDAHILDAMEKNSMAWLSTAYKVDELLKFVYTPIVQQNNPDYPPNMKPKVALKPDENGKPTGTPYATFYDAKEKEIDIKEFEPRGCLVRLAIRADSIWIASKTAGLKWRVLQAQLVERPPARGSFFPAVAEPNDHELLTMECGDDSDPDLA